MFEKLKKHWGVNGFNLTLILITFAFGGSLCGYAARKLLTLINIDKGFVWILLYLLTVTILWPFAVLMVSIAFGQFNFFKGYLKKIKKRMSGQKSTPHSVAIFASGAGSNAEKIIQQMEIAAKTGKGSFKVDLIVCNKPTAGVLSIAANHQIDTLLIEKEQFLNGDGYATELTARGIEFIVLAGFLWKIPVTLIKAYPNNIINIHPALLPKYGGKGMYGDKVHQAVIAAGEKESGITIHYVDEIYDHGNIIFQAKCIVDQKDSPSTLAQKIHQLEHQHYPEVIDNLLQMRNSR
jgi:formyltetrahydrofolate-dependent phosphoribosylglycinamide formyltransferase